mmetsp:Transcript_11718/g.24799  ORF Transcript_11718/g.24799 Transcript_11718/m.24799 type:complete len:86 (+) Transcript_11718:434-691(+)
MRTALDTAKHFTPVNLVFFRSLTPTKEQTTGKGQLTHIFLWKCCDLVVTIYNSKQNQFRLKDQGDLSLCKIYVVYKPMLRVRDLI